MKTFKIFIIIGILSSIFITSFAFFFIKNDLKFRKNGTILIEFGDNITTISNKLKSNEYISNNAIFRYYVNSIATSGKFKILTGEYDIKQGDNFNILIQNMKNGNDIKRKISIPEGMQSRKVERIINENEFLTGDPVTIGEGTILPETYLFTRGLKRSKLLEKMQKDLTNFLNIEWEKKNISDKFIKTPQDVIIFASILEQEAAVNSERAEISGVYHNRLEKKMRLESCPTTIYEITKGQYDLGRPLNKNDLKIKGKYNTYRKFGLPIGPICNPGKNSIIATLRPKKTDALFFVVDKDRKHYFSKDFREHINFKKYKIRKNN